MYVYMLDALIGKRVAKRKDSGRTLWEEGCPSHRSHDAIRRKEDKTDHEHVSGQEQNVRTESASPPQNHSKLITTGLNHGMTLGK